MIQRKLCIILLLFFLQIFCTVRVSSEEKDSLTPEYLTFATRTKESDFLIVAGYQNSFSHLLITNSVSKSHYESFLLSGNLELEQYGLFEAASFLLELYPPKRNSLIDSFQGFGILYITPDFSIKDFYVGFGQSILFKSPPPTQIKIHNYSEIVASKVAKSTLFFHRIGITINTTWDYLYKPSFEMYQISINDREQRYLTGFGGLYSDTVEFSNKTGFSVTESIRYILDDNTFPIIKSDGYSGIHPTEESSFISVSSGRFFIHKNMSLKTENRTLFASHNRMGIEIDLAYVNKMYLYAGFFYKFQMEIWQLFDYTTELQVGYDIGAKSITASVSFKTYI